MSLFVAMMPVIVVILLIALPTWWHLLGGRIGTGRALKEFV